MLVIIASRSVRTNIVYKIFLLLMNISPKNSRKKSAIVKNGNISPGRKYHYLKIYIHNNVWRFSGEIEDVIVYVASALASQLIIE